MVVMKTMEPLLTGPALMGPLSLCIPAAATVYTVFRVPEGQVISDGEVGEEGDCPIADDNSEMDSDSDSALAQGV